MTRRARIDDLLTVTVPEQPALSPDGAWIAYVQRANDVPADRITRSVWRIGVHDGRSSRLTHGPNDLAPAWSPDGTRLAFVRVQEGRPPQIWLLPADGGEAERLTDLPAGAGAPVWNPDGTRIAFTAPVDPDDGPVVTGRLDYQVGAALPFHTTRVHLHVVDVASGRCRRLTDGDWNAAFPAWSPDGTRLAFAADPTADADLTLISRAHVVDVESGRMEPVGPPAGQAGPMIWTADGGSLLLVGLTDTEPGHADLFRIPLAGGEIVNLSALLDRNLMLGGPGYPGALPALAGDGRTVLFCARNRGCTHLYAVDVDGGTPRELVGGAGRVVSGMSAAYHTAAMVLGTPTSFGEVVVLDLVNGTETVRTDHGAPLADLEIFPRVEREFAISDGTTVPAWLIRDPDVTGPGPLLVDIHGGPHNAWNAVADEVHPYHQELVALGWTVLLVNPRGSDGYGEAFYTGAVGAWGEADARDFLEPVDTLVAEGIADPARLAVAGYSYGGFMTCNLTSRDGRFAAAVAGGAISDLASMAGTSDAGHQIANAELGGLPWRHAERYRELSPIARVGRVHTPTLIVHGTADLRCPVGQAQQWHTALRERGVPTELVLYPNASHNFIVNGRPSHRLDYSRRIVDWVERHAGSHRPRIDAEHWRRRLVALAERHRVPGAALGILRLTPGRADDLVEVACGVLNKNTGVPATTDSVFQIGSNTKVWTATLAMQLVEEGVLDLDAPVLDVLPELRLSDPEATKRLTARHLLNHTNGIDGDIFTDTGRGDDCIARYVAGLDAADQIHPPGAAFSYSNTGYVLLGAMIERLTGQTWDTAVRERLIEPLGLAHTVTLPEEALLHRTAAGHFSHGDAEPVPTSLWGFMRAIGPAGAINSTTADVLAFARLHLTGLAPSGDRLLTEASLAAMAAHSVDVPGPSTVDPSWGLGWMRFGWDGHRLIGHDGGAIGQYSFLRVLPEAGLAVIVLTNGGRASSLYEDLFREIFRDVAGIEMPRPIEPPDERITVDGRRHVGRYERAGERFQVSERDGGLVLRVVPAGALVDLVEAQTEEVALVPMDATGDNFAARSPGSPDGPWTMLYFGALSNGKRYLHATRLTPKVD